MFHKDNLYQFTNLRFLNWNMLQIGCFLRIEKFWTTMYSIWRFLRSMDLFFVTKWWTDGSFRLRGSSFLLSSASLLVIATLTAIARIAFEEQSLTSFLVFLVAVIQAWLGKAFLQPGSTLNTALDQISFLSSPRLVPPSSLNRSCSDSWPSSPSMFSSATAPSSTSSSGLFLFASHSVALYSRETPIWSCLTSFSGDSDPLMQHWHHVVPAQQHHQGHFSKCSASANQFWKKTLWHKTLSHWPLKFLHQTFVHIGTLRSISSWEVSAQERKCLALAISGEISQH